MVMPVSTRMPSSVKTCSIELARLRLLRGQQPVGHLEHRHLRAEPRERPAPARTRSAPPPMTARRRRQLGDLHDLAVGPVRRLRQPLDRQPGGRGPDVEHHAARARRTSSSPTRTVPVAGEPPVAPDDAHPGLLEPLDVGVVAPVVGRLLVDPGRDGTPVGRDLGLAGQGVDASGLGERVGRADHHLGRDAAVERALAAHEVTLDADDVEPRLGELLRGVLATRAPGPAPPRPRRRSPWRHPVRRVKDAGSLLWS